MCRKKGSAQTAAHTSSKRHLTWGRCCCSWPATPHNRSAESVSQPDVRRRLCRCVRHAQESSHRVWSQVKWVQNQTGFLPPLPPTPWQCICVYFSLKRINIGLITSTLRFSADLCPRKSCDCVRWLSRLNLYLYSWDIFAWPPQHFLLGCEVADADSGKEFRASWPPRSRRDKVLQIWLSFHPRAIDLISSRVECGLFFGYYFFWVFITQPECFPGDRTEFIRVEVLDGALAGPS